ncbi:MAG: hypothetical protein RJA70_3519 [Pseudomonadota bacterium]|jgi:hypothetical protein
MSGRQCDVRERTLVRNLSALARSVVRVAVGCLSVLSCSPQPNEGNPCPRDVAAFRVELTGPTGELPPETELAVTFGGAGVERYSVERGNRSNKTVCCVPAHPSVGKLPHVSCDGDSTRGAALSAKDAGTDRGVAAIHCELWTDGAAQLEVQAAGHAPFEKTLSAVLVEDETLEECNTLKTRDIRLVLQLGDSGVPR